MLPALIVHCDWSTSPRKRWLATARWVAGSAYEISAPVLVDRIETFFAELRRREPAGPILAGFDFPIGLPARYAKEAGISQFTATLPEFGEGRWFDFYLPANSAAQISVTRPFYPRAPGRTSKQHLVDGLQLGSSDDLLRRCDYSTPARNKACEMFWTLGANQVGKAAIAGWRDLLAPALRDQVISIWPFDGDLPALFEAGRIVVAETYPSEIYSHLGLLRGFGKT